MDELQANCGETAIKFQCHDRDLFGIRHCITENPSMGILLVVGGRQYRVGAHRLYVLLARFLAKNGYAVFRFDVRGMGDSSEQPRNFLDTNDDIDAARKALMDSVPSVNRVLYWGLCDGASASIISANTLRQKNIAGVMMVNPWISSQESAARIRLKHYYRERVFSIGFWKKLVHGKIRPLKSVSALISQIKTSRYSSQSLSKTTELPDLVFNAQKQFTGYIRILISTQDLTAREYEHEFLQRTNLDKELAASTEVISVEADHTFSNRGQYDQLCRLTLDWIENIELR